MNRIKAYFRNQLDEISADRALRIYGAFIAFCYALCFWAWVYADKVVLLSTEADPICWPFFENCFEYRFLSHLEAKVLVSAYFALCLIGVLLFFIRRFVRLAYIWLIVLFLFNVLIYVQDFRFRMNQHYMLYFITLAFLFLPHKRNLIRYALVAFYFWAGAIKLNVEWLSGAALYSDPLWIHGKWIPAACVYTVILEMFLVWGILSSRRWLFWLTFFQLSLFHLVSWPVVGFFYPLLMYGLLMIFPLTHFIPGDEKESLLTRLFRGKEPAAVYVYLVFFSLCQIVPVAMPGDEKITGEGRLFALHMFDARVFCDGEITVRYKDGNVKTHDVPLDLTPRIKCDPVVNFSRAKYQCYLHRNDPDFEDVDLLYSARRNHEESMKPLVEARDICSRKLNYHMLLPNTWIFR